MVEDKILCVDDDRVVLFALQRDLRNRFQLVTAESGDEAITLIKSQGPFAVILADMRMPEMSGVELLAQTQRIAPDTVRIMLTGDDDRKTAVEAINEGNIFRFLTKPCIPEKLVAALIAALEYYRLIQTEKGLLEQTLNGSVKMLTELLSVGEPEAFGRGQKICEYIRLVAPGLDLGSTWDIEVAAMLAQIGSMTIPPSIVQKHRAGQSLDPAEKEMLDRVPEIGSKVLSQIPRLGSAAQIILHQSDPASSAGQRLDPIKSLRLRKAVTLLKMLSELVDLESQGVGRTAAFQQMRAGRRPYVGTPVFDFATNSLLAQESPTGKTIRVQLKDLAPGHELLSPIQTLRGRLIAPAGTIISPMLLERFNNFAAHSGIQEPIYVRVKPSR